jgi:peptide deformylase
MAIRNIVKGDEDILYKISRPVEKFDDRLWQLLDDMAETLKKADGCGLAAVQVGVLRRICIVDVMDEDGLIELINPKIVGQSGIQEQPEGCLSFPGEYAVTRRPNSVVVEAQDRYGKVFKIKGEGLKARAFCHEIDHLDGIVYKQHVIRELEDED